jgi:hypothetical protein
MEACEFKVRFKGHGTLDHKWIPYANLENCWELVREYWDKHGPQSLDLDN